MNLKDRNYLRYLGNNRQYYVTASYDEHCMSEIWGPWRVEIKECTDYDIYPNKKPYQVSFFGTGHTLREAFAALRGRINVCKEFFENTDIKR